MTANISSKAASVLLTLESADLSYCLKLAKHFEHMGIDSEQASSALCSLVEDDMLDGMYQSA